MSVTVPQTAGVNPKVVFCNVRPVGKVSSTLTVVKAPGLPPGFASVRVNVVLPPDTIEVAPKAFVNVGGMYTFKVSVVKLALFPAVVFNAPAAIVFTAAPAVLLVTSTMIVQPPAAIEVPLAIVKLVAAAVAVTPLHVPVFPVVLIVIPVGKVSVNALVNVIALTLLFPIVNVRLVFPPATIFVNPKAFAIVGGANIANVAFAVVPVKATGPVAAGAPVVLVLVLVAVTLCVIIQLSPGSSVPAVKPTAVPPSAPPVNVALLPVLQTTPPAALFTKVPTYVSPMLTPVRLPGLPAGLVTIITIEDVPPDEIEVGVKLFVTVGGA